jgi:hypothetical protein
MNAWTCLNLTLNAWPAVQVLEHSFVCAQLHCLAACPQIDTLHRAITLVALTSLLLLL